MLRFDRTARWVHGSAGVLVLVCLVTAAVLYAGPLAVLIGRRPLVERVHVWSGLALPVPLLAGLLSGTFRADLARLERFTPDDWRWLRRRDRRSGELPVGKFNAGQKLNTALTAAGLAVLLLTGTLMEWTGLVRLSWRTGATFVHDLTALALGLLVLGHLNHAFADRTALRGMWSGRVGLAWSRHRHPAWADEVAGPEQGPPP